MCLLARMMAANFYYNQIENLMFEVFISFENLLIFGFPFDKIFLIHYFLSWQLSMWRCTDEFRAKADEIHRNSRKDAAKHYIGLKQKTLFKCAFANFKSFFSTQCRVLEDNSSN